MFGKLFNTNNKLLLKKNKILSKDCFIVLLIFK